MSTGNGHTDDLTPIQRKMLAILEDGKPHKPQKLHACLMDELGPIRNIRSHLTGLRKHLHHYGKDIYVVRLFRKVYYQMMPVIQDEE